MERVLVNPVVPGFAPDPSIVYVDGTYFLVNSSFHIFPGLPIYASRDLREWKHIGNALNRTGQLSLQQSVTKIVGPEHPYERICAEGGLYAPTIRYHEGTFHIVCTNVIHTRPQASNESERHNFILWTTDIWADEWSDPLFYDFMAIDTSLFWDDDGRVYVIGASGPPPDTKIRQFEIDLKTGKKLSEEKIIWEGISKVYPEGPHMYKKDGWYYLLIAEGGCIADHHTIIARSRNIWGPYDPNPANPVLDKTDQEGYIQYTGHGDLFQDPSGQWYFAVELARQVDVPIVIAGLNADYESEAVDRKDLRLPPGVDELIERVAKVNPRTIIVNQSGCPVTMPWLKCVPTLIHAWFGGQETGNGIADVLFGRYNPSGRLSVTFPRRLEDTPAFLSYGKGLREMYYGEGVFIGYRYYEKLQSHPLFYFGYGLSYTTFEYSNLQVPARVDLGNQGDGAFVVSVDVTNTGDRDGHEVVQVYISDVECAALRPRKELKGFAKIWVAKGDTATAEIRLGKYALSHWDEEEEKWHAERGVFKVIISRSADPRDEVLDRDFELTKSLYWTGV
ncbi:Fn3-like domain-containing protein [Fusarium sp. Ph1]|nr:Fn3-like domain-containing protein [Fusarium sp. Ph1]